MTQFYLIRHGEADYPLADTYHLIGGAREWVPLTARGGAQVAQLAQQLRDVAPQREAIDTADYRLYIYEVS